LNRQLFYDEGPAVRAVALEKTLQYQEAQAACQQAVSLNPNDIDALLRLGTVEEKLGNLPEALKRAEKALVQTRKVYGEEHPYVATSYNNIGVALEAQGKYDKALVCKQKALTIQIKLLGEEHPDVRAI
jgi:tetratricopeptide (TPR) repeat protein